MITDTLKVLSTSLHVNCTRVRYLLAEMTNRASTFTEGVLEMEKTVLGIIQVDARQILHDGLRKELVRQVSLAMHGTLIFVNEKTGVASQTQADVRLDFDRAMGKLAKQMDGFRRSIEYIQVIVQFFVLFLQQGCAASSGTWGFDS